MRTLGHLNHCFCVSEVLVHFKLHDTSLVSFITISIILDLGTYLSCGGWYFAA